MKIFLIFIICFSFAFADSEHHYNRDLTYLNLNSVQKKQIVKILKNYRKEMKQYREKRESIVKIKQKFFTQDIFDGEKITKENRTISSQAIKIEINFLKNMHDILSKKQRIKFAKYMEDWDTE